MVTERNRARSYCVAMAILSEVNEITGYQRRGETLNVDTRDVKSSWKLGTYLKLVIKAMVLVDFREIL